MSTAVGRDERDQRGTRATFRNQKVQLIVGAVAVGVAVARNGFGHYPLAGFLARDVAPSWPDLPADVPPLFQYLLWSVPGPALARLLRVHSEGQYVALHVAVFLVGIATFVAVVRSRLGRDAVLPVLLTLVALPATTVVLAWSGSYDTFTVVLALHLAVCRSPRWAFLLGVGLALSALEHGVLIVVGLLVLAVAGIWGDRRVLVAAAGGIGVAGVGLNLWLRSQDITHGRSYWLSHFGLRYFWRMTVHGWPLLALSLFGALWPLAAVLIRHAPPGRRLVVSACLLFPIAPMLVTEDQTRVFAVLSGPLLVAVLLGQLQQAREHLRPALVGVAVLVWLPGFYVWKGSPHLADWTPWSVVLR